MKFIKGVTTFLVLCLAAYGAFTLYTNLTKPPKIDLTGDDVEYLEGIGIKVRGNGRASESGINSMIDIEGVEPIGTSAGTSSSFAPPAFLGGQTAPVFTEAAPPYAAENPPLTFDPASPAPAFPEPPVEVFPPQNIAEPAGVPAQSPSVQPPSVQPLPAIVPHSAAPQVPATESPPPWKDHWDGPASDITATPLPSGHLLTSIPPRPNTNPLPSSNVRTTSPHDGESVRRIESGLNKQNSTFAATDAVPMGAVPTQYTQTAARQSLTGHPIAEQPLNRQPLAFEPAKPESSSKTHHVAFAPPKRNNSSPLPQPVAVHSGLKHVENSPLRSIESSGDALSTAQPLVPKTIERFIQSQQQLMETGESENIRLAFIQLSRLYEQNQLGPSEKAMMRQILDPLAFNVIYSKDSHILESPYKVKPGETVESIAKDFNLNPVLLRKINGLSVPHELTPGTTLKVMYGQFDARISIKQKELTLLLGGLYAGQFSFTFPNVEVPVWSGEFFVTHRTDQMVALNNGWVLGTTHVKDATIVFADQDAREIFDILSEQSVIVVE